MSTSFDLVRDKAKQAMEFHAAEAQGHLAERDRMASFIKTLDELSGVNAIRGEGSESEKPTAGAGDLTIVDRVNRLLTDHPGLSNAEIAERLDLTTEQVKTPARMFRKSASNGSAELSPPPDDPAADPESEPEHEPEEADGDDVHEPEEVAEVAPPRSSPPKVSTGQELRIRNPETGLYLHQDIAAMIRNKGKLHFVEGTQYAWRNTRSKWINLCEALPSVKALVAEPVTR